MKKHISKFVLLLFVIFFPITSVYAKGGSGLLEQNTTSDSECFALDVIFIIDQSNSMGYGPRKSDPTDQREKAVEAMTNWLIENSLDHCKNARHQVGVVSFGDKSQIDLPLSEIAPKSFDAALSLQERLEEKIIAAGLGNTQPMGAFELARKMFDESALKDIGQRKQVIVMLTDGLINAGEGNNPDGFVIPTQKLADYINQNFAFDPTLKEREACIQERVKAHGGDFDNVPYEQVNQCMQEFDVDSSAYQNSTYVFIVLMNFREEGWPEDIRKIYRGVAESHMGEMMDFHEAGVENRNAIPEYFRTVLAAMVGVPSGRVSCGPVAVNAYLDKATFVFYKFSEDTDVSLRYTDASGKVFEISRNQTNDPSGFDVLEYESYGPNERYTLNDPYPGIWYIESDRCSSDGVSAFYQEVKINPGGYTLPITTIQQYDLEPYYDVSAPSYLTYEMRNEAGEIVEVSQNPFFLITITATVKDPIGGMKDYSLVWNESEDLFVATEPLKVRDMGEYHVSIKGDTPYYPGNNAPITGALPTTFNGTQTLFQHDQLVFTVTEVKPFVVKIDEPEENLVLGQIHENISKGWPLKIRPIQTSARIDWRDAPLDQSINDVLVDPNNSFESWIEFADGSTSERINLRIDPLDPQRLLGTFTDVDSTSPMTIHTELIGESYSEFRPDFRHTEVSFSRTDKSILTRPGFYRLIMLILAGIMLIATLIQFLKHFDPVQGTLSFYQDQQSMGDVEVYSRKKSTKIKKSVLEGLDLQTLVVSYKPFIKSSEYEDEGEIRRSVQLDGKTLCGQKFKFDLEADGGNNYCTDHPEFEVRYQNPGGGQKPKLNSGIYMLLPTIPLLLIVLFFIMK